MRKRLLIFSFLIIILSAAAGYWLTHQPLPDLGEVRRPQSSVKPTTTNPVAFDKTTYSLDDPTSIWLVVNKKRPLNPANYAPADLVTPTVAKRDGGMQIRRETSQALTEMFAAADQAGKPLKLASAYRSYDYQVNLYNGYVKTQGQAEADSQSARPGYSEHQTGMAADVSPLDGTCNLQQCFADTLAGQWVAANAYKYGFLVRYGKDDTAITGYSYEPWHVRYIGKELAAEMHKQNILTLEQFFNLPAAPGY
jgi:D-alanyl-D-alanine carboxypeptidase